MTTINPSSNQFASKIPSTDIATANLVAYREGLKNTANLEMHTESLMTTAKLLKNKK